MKFYRKSIPGLHLPGIIWNPDRGRQWCSFDESGGVVETEDPKLIAVLLGFGFPNDGEAVAKAKKAEAERIATELEATEKAELEAAVIADAEKANEPEIAEPEIEAQFTRAEIEEVAEEDEAVILETDKLTTVETDSVEVEIVETEESGEVVIEEDDILVTQIKDSKVTPTYKTKTELRKLNKVELEAYALETFGVQIDSQHNWMQLQKEIASLGAALEE